ncbi:MAG: hypothetical protein OXI39_08545 [Gemmatimonadota bacterium]|uniref:hypothetical protein n=1 Tax=Candidatus Palauibacter scopulicola TaxID=3056741 RepID=UPI0023973117|nr:hypothetical protein [Candidatus Palauibacter scopulicola]MDE2663037.1 hypothetical protein [Candidatus Palauibacter scopulicola]
MPKPNAHTPRAGADAGRTRVDDRSSRSRVRPSGAADGITVTRWSLGLSLTVALTVVTAAFTLVWNQTVRLGETQVQLVASIAGVNDRVAGIEPRMSTLETRLTGIETRLTGIETHVTGLELRVTGLESEVREMREGVAGLSEEVRELADLIRDRGLPDPPTQ